MIPQQILFQRAARVNFKTGYLHTENRYYHSKHGCTYSTDVIVSEGGAAVG